MKTASEPAPKPEKKHRDGERRHNRSGRRKKPETKGQLTPGMTETQIDDKRTPPHCGRCGFDIPKGVRLCGTCRGQVEVIIGALKKFPPLRSIAA